MFEKIKEKNIGNIAVDLRNNGGGSSNVIIEFLHWNKKKAFKFVITNSFDNFVSIYKEYLDLIIEFLKIKQNSEIKLIEKKMSS